MAHGFPGMVSPRKNRSKGDVLYRTLELLGLHCLHWAPALANLACDADKEADVPTTMRNSEQHLRGARTSLFRVVVLGLWSALGTGLGLWVVPRAIDSWRSRDDRAYSIERERRSLRSDNPPSPESFFPTEALSRPPIVTGFQILSAQEVGERILDDELVLGVELVDGLLLDQSTGSQWEMLTGRAVAGDMRGKRLTLLPAFPSDGAVWQAYHPGTTRWQWAGP